MKCLLKYRWVKLMRSHLPQGKGVMGAWARLASSAAFRKGNASYCGYKNPVTPGMRSGGIVGLKSILGVRTRKQALETMDTLSRLGYIKYELDPHTKKLTYLITDWVVECSGEECAEGNVYATDGYGFLCLPRSITQRLSDNKYIFDESDAWLDLWCRTVYMDKHNAFSFLAPAVQYENCGAVLTLETLGRRWGWEKTKVWRFFKKYGDVFALYRLPGSYGCLVFNKIYPVCEETVLPAQDKIMRILEEIRILAKGKRKEASDHEHINKMVAWYSKNVIETILSEPEKTRVALTYHNTLMLLKHYRTIAWMLECFPDSIAEELDQPFGGLDELIDRIDIESSLDNKKLESRIAGIQKSRILLDRVNEALTVLKKKPSDGERLYNLIYQTYITPEKLSLTDLLYRLDLVVGVLCYTSPLAYAMGASKATGSVFKSWCRMVGSQLLLLVMNVWFLRAFNSSVGQYIGNGGALSTGQGNIFLWMFCALAFLKTAQKFDSYLASMGLNVAQTGSSMGMEMLMAARVLSGVSGGVKSAGNVFKGGSAVSGAGAAGAGFAAGFVNKFKGNSYVRDAVVNGGSPMGAGGTVGFVGRAFGGIAARNGAKLTGDSIASVASKASNVSGSIAGDIADRSLENFMPHLSGQRLSGTNITGGQITTTATSADGKEANLEMYGG